MEKIISLASEGFATVPVPAEVQASALKYLKQWLTEPQFGAYVPAVLDLLRRQQFGLLVDSFYRLIPFGTGGRRGAVGVGPNRINPYTVTTSVAGHCRFLKLRRPLGPWTVVIAWDVREFRDARGLYSRASLGALWGLSSRDLAGMAAGVYAANDVHVVMEDPESGRFVSTPELSYHVYRLGADGGLNVSASHNPPDDNGTKFYNPAGGQEVPPHDEELVMVASSVEEAEQMAFEDARSTGWVRYLTPEEYQGYLDENLALSLRPGCRDVGVAFSSLHGTGAFNVLPVLQQAGFHVENLERQAGLDGAFPTVPGHTANPEIPEVMAAVMDWAEARSCDIAMATDPDADRLGVAIRNSKGRFLSLTGNQIGLLVANYLLARRKEDGLLSPECWVAKTEVTTGALQALADAFGVRCIGHLLVGFKYIGDVLDHAARLGTWNGVSLAPEGFVMAMEESHGYLVSPRIRDKDAANAALILAEYAAWCAKQGTGLLQELHGIYRRLGYFATGLSSMTMEGAVGMEEIAGLQASLRANPPQEIGGRKVVSSEDRQDPAGVFGTIRSGTDASSRDVLVFTLEGGGRLVLRPSGTEPKNKTYVELWGSPAGDMGADEFVQAMGAIDEEVRQILGCWRNELMVRLQQIRNRNRGGG